MRKPVYSKSEETSEDDNHKSTSMRRGHSGNRRVAVIDEEQKQVYNCEDCEATFTTTMGLKYHRECVHEGIRYECDRCDYKAATKSNLVRHKESIHESATKGHLKKHKNRKHI